MNIHKVIRATLLHNAKINQYYCTITINCSYWLSVSTFIYMYMGVFTFICMLHSFKIYTSSENMTAYCEVVYFIQIF